MVLHRAVKENKPEDEQRRESAASLADEIAALRKITGYRV